MRVLLIFVTAMLLMAGLSAQNAKKFTIENGEFLVNNQPVKIYSGEMHYARVPKEYWRHRLQMLKAMGLNTVATYVFWNYHHPEPGIWDFKSGNKNIGDFLELAKEEGLMVILRPGPYACAEWEFGGYPWWLLRDTALQIRTYNQPFLDSCRDYISRLGREIKPHLVTAGGAVVMVQMENEFGSYVSQTKHIDTALHKKYKYAIKDMLEDAKIDVPMFTSDGVGLFAGGAVEGVLPTANGETNVNNIRRAVNRFHDGKGPYMVAEYYPGWLHHWGEPFPSVPSETIVKHLETYLQNDIHFNIYMAHGGTNFSFTSGANYNDEHHIQPDLTTYDYDAPVSEPGWATPKFHAIRELMKKYVKYELPQVPAEIPVITIPPIKLSRSISVFDQLDKFEKVVSDSLLSFEDLNQGHGYVLYRTKVNQPVHGTLTIDGLRDFATIYVNKKKVGELNRMNNIYSMPVDIPFNATLDILVENMGRINYGSEIVNNRKGIISPVLIDDMELSGTWEMFKLPFTTMPDVKAPDVVQNKLSPTIYAGSFNVNKTGDVFLDMQSWGKGIIFVNGHNIGRYWKVGPQQTLYLPGCWLKKGKNEIVVFEQLNDNVVPEIPTVPLPKLTYN